MFNPCPNCEYSAHVCSGDDKADAVYYQECRIYAALVGWKDTDGNIIELNDNETD